MTSSEIKNRIRDIQNKYPQSWVSPPPIGVIKYLDENEKLLYEEVHGTPFVDLLKYEDQAKESHDSQVNNGEMHWINKSLI